VSTGFFMPSAAAQERSRKFEKIHREERNADRRARYARLKAEGKLRPYKPRPKYFNKKNSLKRLYGITVEQYNEILTQQNGVCKICENPPTEQFSLSTDHCHETNKIRGLLCNSCNNGLGRFKDDISLMERAIKYLKGEL
jgi:hypothetical protein